MLEELLQNQHDKILELFSLLKEERKFLQSRDADQIVMLANNKEKILKEINKIDAKISQHKDVDLLKNNQQIIKQKENLELILKKCQEENTINGKIIQENLVYTKKLATSLQFASQKNSVTYDNLGNTRSGKRIGNGILV